MTDIDRLGSPAPDSADFEICCWRCDDPSPADVYARVVRNAGDSLKTTIRSGHAICQSHLAELENDDGTEVRVLEKETRTVRGANHSHSLFAATDHQEADR